MAKYQETVLKNGLRLITATDNSSVAVVSLWIKAGSRYENKLQMGYSHFWEHLLYNDVVGLHRSMDKNNIGAQMNAWTSRESMYFFIEASESHLDYMLSILAKSARNLTSDNKFETEKKVIIQEMQIAKDNPLKVLANQSLKIFFKNHPLAQEPLGSPESVGTATPEQLNKYKNLFLIPERSAVIVTSNLEHNMVLNMAIKHFESWQSNIKKPTENPKIDTPKINAATNYLYIPSSKKQTLIMINFYTPGASNLKEAAALEVTANYLGQGHTSFLDKKLREETGLVYGINSYNFRYTDVGRFQISTSSSEPVKTVEIIFKSLSDFLDQVSPTEIESTKEGMINIFSRINTNPIKKIKFLGQGFILFNHLFEPGNYENLIKEVTYEDVVGVGGKYLNRNNALLSVMGPEDIKI